MTIQIPDGGQETGFGTGLIWHTTVPILHNPPGGASKPESPSLTVEQGVLAWTSVWTADCFDYGCSPSGEQSMTSRVARLLVLAAVVTLYLVHPVLWYIGLTCGFVGVILMRRARDGMTTVVQ